MILSLEIASRRNLTAINLNEKQQLLPGGNSPLGSDGAHLNAVNSKSIRTVKIRNKSP